MNIRTMTIVLALVLGAALAGCAPATSPEPGAGAPATGPEPGVGAPAGDGSAGTRLANGLYDQEDGSVIAIGTLERIDLEGGFWAITGAPGSGGNIAVIANADEFTGEIEALAGKTVQITGTRFDGVSIRMAGPEVMMKTIEEVSDTPGAAE